MLSYGISLFKLTVLVTDGRCQSSIHRPTQRKPRLRIRSPLSMKECQLMTRKIWSRIIMS